MCGQSLRQQPEDLATQLLTVIQELCTELHPRRPAAWTLDSSLDRDIGLDSLSRLELLGRVEERFQVTLSERVFTDSETPREILRAIKSARPGEKKAARDAVPLSTGEELGEAAGAPHAAQTLLDVLDWHVAHHRDRPHIRFYRDDGEGESITYGELSRSARWIAAGLVDKGLETGEPVAIMLPPTSEYFFSFFGVLFAGGIPVPLYPPARPARIEEHLRRQVSILNNCAAKTLITVREALRFTQLLEPHVESLRCVVTASELIDERREPVRTTAALQDAALVQYTSGSTGDPKGVELTHGNLLANVRGIGGAVSMDSTDVGVSWLPLYHDMGLIGAWFCSLYHAFPLVVMSPFDFLARPERWLWAIHRHRGTLSVGPNFAYEICATRLKDDDVKGLDLSSWRVAFNGAEPVNPDTIEKFSERFGRHGFRREAMTPVYGLAESTVGLAFPPYGRGPVVDRIRREPLARDGRAVAASSDDPTALRFVACGRPLPGHEIRIVDPGGHELPDGYQGRLQFRGPSATSGYFRNPGANRALFDGHWLDSGDVAYISNGDVYITGRSKDIIIRAGRNIYPHELEAAVGEIPGVRKGNIAVFGTTDREKRTERLIVVTETRDDDPATLERIRSDIFGVTTDIVGTPPDDVVFAPRGTIPKTTSGKIRRSACRDLYERGKIGEAHHALWWQVARLALHAFVPSVKRFRRRATEVLFAVYMVLVTAVIGVFSWAAVTFAPRLSWRWKTVRWATRMIARLTCIRLVLRGGENFPRDHRCVLVSNHASYLDSFFLSALLPVPISFVAKAELKRNPIVHGYLRRLDTEFVVRWDKQRGIEDARRIGGRAREGRMLLFFAEGGMSRRPGLRSFRMGAFVAAAEAGLPVVAVTIRGTRSILRPDTYLIRRGTATVTIAPPIDTQKLRQEMQADAWTLALKIREISREEILRRCGEPDLGDEPA